MCEKKFVFLKKFTVVDKVVHFDEITTCSLFKLLFNGNFCDIFWLTKVDLFTERVFVNFNSVTSPTNIIQFITKFIYNLMLCEKNNRSFVLSGTLGSTIPVGNLANLNSHWKDGPLSWDFPVPTELQ